MNKQELLRLQRLHFNQDNNLVLLKKNDPICSYYSALRDKEIAKHKQQKTTYNIDIEAQQHTMSIFGTLMNDDTIKNEDFHKTLSLHLKDAY